MKRTILASVVVLMAALTVHQFFKNHTAINPPADQFGRSESAGRTDPGLSIPGAVAPAFTENHGQWSDEVRFRARSGRAVIWFTDDGVYYHFRGAPFAQDGAVAEPYRMREDNVASDVPEVADHVVNASFAGASDDAVISGLSMTEARSNYLIGNDPNKWQTDVPSYGGVIVENLYEGIDLKYYFDGNRLEYDFIAAPGADPSQIEVRYDGIESMSVSGDGRLVVKTEWATVTELEPVIYQQCDDGLTLIEGRYVILSDNSFGFELDDSYDPALTLVIDPALLFSTYLGGEGSDEGCAIAVDGSGNVYVAGETESIDFPTEGAFQTDQGYQDVFVSKFNESGDVLIYSTYLGGDTVDVCWDMTVDAAGCAYLAGETYSSDFPTENPFQAVYNGGWDAFVTKLSAAGNYLEYSTYLGGDSIDVGRGVAVDGSGFAYVTGRTFSANFPTKNAYQAIKQGKSDIFLTKLGLDGDTLVYSTFLGGTLSDNGCDIALDAGGYIYIAGQSSSSDFPTVNAYQTDYGGFGDIVSVKLTPAADALVYSTYIGGTGGETAVEIGLDNEGYAYVLATVSGSDSPVKNPYQTDQGDWDMYIAKLGQDGDTLVYATYLGGSDREEAYGLAVTGDGYAFAVGRTLSDDYPTQNPYQEDYEGSFDAVVTRFSTTGQSLIYSTYIGGQLEDDGMAIAIDASGLAYIAGRTASSDYPTVNPYQADQQGSLDAFVTKLECTSDYVVSTLDDSGPGSLREAIEVINASESHDTITFSVSGTIELVTPLPPFDGDGGAILDDGFVIYGSTAPGGAHSVVLDGSALVSGDGLVINSNFCGSSTVEGLTIRNFPGNGITVITTDPPVYHRITNNLIYDNDGLGIDIGGDGVTSNDFPDDDGVYNFPYIDSIRMQPDNSFIVFGVSGEADAWIEFYVAHPARDITRPADPSGHGEAYSYVGTDTTGGMGGTFAFTVENTVEFFTELTATASFRDGNSTGTSEFCENLMLVPSPLIVTAYSYPGGGKGAPPSVVNLWITDPDGLQIGRDAQDNLFQNLFPADYLEEGPDYHDSVVIYYPKVGEYVIEVFPEEHAEDGDQYSTGVIIDGSAQVVLAHYNDVQFTAKPDSLEYVVEEGWHYVNGDADGSEGLDIDDVVYLIAYIFSGGPIPDPPDAGDADCSYALDIDDVVYLVAYIFSGGPQPCATE